MKKKTNVSQSKTNFKKLDAMKDSDIDYSDIPELSDDFAESAEWFIPARMHDPAHPGEIIHELVLKPLNLSVAKAASHLGVSRKTLSKVLNGRGMVTPEMAVRLEKTFGKPSAEHWLKLQSAHDPWQTRQYADEFEVEPVNRNAA